MSEDSGTTAEGVTVGGAASTPTGDDREMTYGPPARPGFIHKVRPVFAEPPTRTGPDELFLGGSPRAAAEYLPAWADAPEPSE